MSDVKQNKGEFRFYSIQHIQNSRKGETNMLAFLKSQKGQDLAEYALLIGLIALVVLVAVTLLGTSLTDVFNTIAAEVGTWFTG